MSKQNKNVSVELNAAVIKSLGRAGLALSELAGAWVTATNEGCPGTRRTSR